MRADLSSGWWRSRWKFEYLMSMYVFGREPRKLRKKRDRKLLKVRDRKDLVWKRWGKTKS
jgi:hypothetical protein